MATARGTVTVTDIADGVNGINTFAQPLLYTLTSNALPASGQIRISSTNLLLHGEDSAGETNTDYLQNIVSSGDIIRVRNSGNSYIELFEITDSGEAGAVTSYTITSQSVTGTRPTSGNLFVEFNRTRNGERGEAGETGNDGLPGSATVVRYTNRVSSVPDDSGEYRLLQSDGTNATSYANVHSIQVYDTTITDRVRDVVITDETHIRYFVNSTNWALFQITEDPSRIASNTVTSYTVSREGSRGSTVPVVDTNFTVGIGWDVAVGEQGDDAIAVNVSLNQNSVVQNTDGTYPNTSIIVTGSSKLGNQNTESRTIGTIIVATDGTTSFTQASNVMTFNGLTPTINYSTTTRTISFTVGGIEDTATVLLGNAGTAGVDAPDIAEGIVYFSMAQSDTPSTPSADDYNYQTGAFTNLTGSWQTSPVRVNITNTTLNYYSSRFRAIRNPGENVATITFTTPIASINFGENIQSDNFVTGSTGWQIQRDTGNAEFDNVTIRNAVVAGGTFSAPSIIGGTISATNLSGITITGGSLNVDTINAGTIIANNRARTVNQAHGANNLITNDGRVSVSGTGTITPGGTIVVPTQLSGTSEPGNTINRNWDIWVPFRFSITNNSRFTTTGNGTGTLASPRIRVGIHNGTSFIRSTTLQPFANTPTRTSFPSVTGPVGLTDWATASRAQDGGGTENVINNDYRIISRHQASVSSVADRIESVPDTVTTTNDGGTITITGNGGAVIGSGNTAVVRTIALPTTSAVGDTIATTAFSATGSFPHASFGSWGFSMFLSNSSGAQIGPTLYSSGFIAGGPGTTSVGRERTVTIPVQNFTVTSANAGATHFTISGAVAAQFNTMGMDDDPATASGSFNTFNATTVQSRTVVTPNPDIIHPRGGWTSRDGAASDVTFDRYEIAGFIRFSETTGDLAFQLENSTNTAGGSVFNPAFTYTFATFNWAPGMGIDENSYPNTEVAARIGASSYNATNPSDEPAFT